MTKNDLALLVPLVFLATSDNVHYTFAVQASLVGHLSDLESALILALVSYHASHSAFHLGAVRTSLNQALALHMIFGALSLFLDPKFCEDSGFYVSALFENHESCCGRFHFPFLCPVRLD